jgi:hypothetical protein
MAYLRPRAQALLSINARSHAEMRYWGDYVLLLAMTGERPPTARDRVDGASLTSDVEYSSAG